MNRRSSSSGGGGPLVVARFHTEPSLGNCSSWPGGLISAIHLATGVTVAPTDFEPPNDRCPGTLRFTVSCNTDANSILAAGSCALPGGFVAQFSVLEERSKASSWRCTQCGEFLPLRGRFCMMW